MAIALIAVACSDDEPNHGDDDINLDRFGQSGYRFETADVEIDPDRPRRPVGGLPG